ncbi:hypothetical protein Tcan_01930 [Toxocara canis]|uniref:Uncharacterized protein n=1 Tax=Toxocara canis TaxID=6265 RepID=A0A0B2VU50_TOXCA|nr:hypothetical protein Tcan_01930 [Toxocara canis]
MRAYAVCTTQIYIATPHQQLDNVQRLDYYIDPSNMCLHHCQLSHSSHQMNTFAFCFLIALATYSVANEVAVRTKRCTCMQSSCSCVPVVLSIQMSCSCPQVLQPCACGQAPQPCQPVCQDVCQRQCVHSQCVPVCWNTCSSTCQQQPAPIITVPPQTIPTIPPTLPTIPPTTATLPPVTQPPQQCCTPVCRPCVQVTIPCVQIMYAQCYCVSGYGPCGNGNQCCRKR